MVRLTDTITVAAPVGSCLRALATASRASAGGLALTLGGRRVEYRGHVDVLAVDEERHRAVLSARARTAGGDGWVTATIAAALAPCPAGTSVDLVTDLVVAGRDADIGRALLPAVGQRFVAGLAGDLAAAADRGAAGVPDGGVAVVPDGAAGGPVAPGQGPSRDTAAPVDGAVRTPSAGGAVRGAAAPVAGPVAMAAVGEVPRALRVAAALAIAAAAVGAGRFLRRRGRGRRG